VNTPFYGGYGLIAEDGIPKPAFNAFKLLHQLGNERIDLDSNSALLTRRKNGTLALAIWNYAPPEQAGSPKTLTLRLKGTNAKQALISRLDHDHGDFHSVWEKIAAPRYPSLSQIEELRQAADLPPPEARQLKNRELTITLPAHGLALIELR
jgi:xylan 1,4-beta-xylosidase